MTQKRTGRRAGGRQANIVGTASSSAAGFGGLSGVAGNTGVTLTKTTSPVSPAGLSTVGGLQESGAIKVATPVVVGGGSSGPGSSSGGGSTGSGVVKLPVKELPGAPIPNPTGSGSSGSGSTSGSLVLKPTVTQPAIPTGGSSSSGSSSGIGPVKKTVEELPGTPNPNPTGGSIVLPAGETGNEDKETVTAPAGFGDRFVLNPAVEAKIEFNDEVKEDMVMEEKEISGTPGFGGMDGLTTVGGQVEDILDGNGSDAQYTAPGFGGIEGLVNRPELEYPQDPLPGEVGVEAQKDPVDDNPEVPTTETLAKSGSGKKWLWLIVAAVALWFVFKKK